MCERGGVQRDETGKFQEVEEVLRYYVVRAWRPATRTWARGGPVDRMVGQIDFWDFSFVLFQLYQSACMRLWMLSEPKIMRRH
jgi:hypothetical protein